MSMMRWDPWREMAQLRSLMDRAFDEPYYRGSMFEGNIPTDVYVDDNDVTVKMALPGIKPEDVEITVANDLLTVRCDSKSEKEDKREDRYLAREMRHGRFQRTITLPFPVESEQADANFEHGVLTVHLPKSEAVKPKRISIGGADGQRQMAGSQQSMGQPGSMNQPGSGQMSQQRMGDQSQNLRNQGPTSSQSPTSQSPQQQH